MKLLNKINRTYAAFSFIIYIIGLFLIFLFMNYYIAEETDEKLYNTKLNVVKNLNNGNIVNFYPFIEIKELTNGNYYIKEEIKDTLFYNYSEKDFDNFRQLKFIHKISNNAYLIYIRSEKLEPFDLLYPIGLPLSLLLLLVVLASNFTINKISKRIWNPFYKNLESLKNFSIDGKKQLNLINTDINEFNDLNKSLKELTERVSDDYKRLKEFSENAAHELQTPVAIIKAKIEAMLQEESLTDNIVSQLKIINETANKLSKINKSLTILTKINSKEYEEKKEISLKSFIEKKVEDFIEIADSKKIIFNLNLEDDIILNINKDLLELLISNLIINAIKHNIEGGKVIIKINKRRLIIKNTGTPLEEDSNKMFERFKKGKNAKESTGLGLAIVKQICKLYNFNISYSINNKWHIINLEF